jgi:hypothetical protein
MADAVRSTLFMVAFSVGLVVAFAAKKALRSKVASSSNKEAFMTKKNYMVCYSFLNVVEAIGTAAIGGLLAA